MILPMDTNDIPQHLLHDIVMRALHEDIGDGDRTTLALIPAEAQATARIVTREAAVVAGLPVLAAVFRAVDPHLAVSWLAADGDHVGVGAPLASVQGSARSILTGERVALNFFQRMCGIATLTARFVAALEGLPTRILDTRKTTPGLRVFEKYAVRMGGGVNHRSGLYDAVMIKDNHIKAAGGIVSAVDLVRKKYGAAYTVEVEADTVDIVEEACKTDADIIMLDNMDNEEISKALDIIDGKMKVEVSGNITEERIKSLSSLDIDYMSIGALTHSVTAFDYSMNISS